MYIMHWYHATWTVIGYLTRATITTRVHANIFLVNPSRHTFGLTNHTLSYTHTSLRDLINSPTDVSFIY